MRRNIAEGPKQKLLGALGALLFWGAIALAQGPVTLPASGPCPAEAKPSLPPKAEWAGLMGEYAEGTQLYLICERHGRLMLLAQETPSGQPAPDVVAEPAAPGGKTAAGKTSRPKAGRPAPVAPRFSGEFNLEEKGKDRFQLRLAGAGNPVDVTFLRGKRGVAETCLLGGYPFPRRLYGPEIGQTFRIKPQRPVEALRQEALAAQPPTEGGDFAVPDWVDAGKVTPAVKLDVRYATTDNFMGAAFYPAQRAFLQRPAAEALARAARRLQVFGLGLVIHDAYRPWYVTRMFWDATPPAQREFVADPAKGSRHNRGSAVDVSFYVLATGALAPMVSGYDEFSPRAGARYPGGSALERWHRDLLRCVMEGEGFKIYEAEWWHFDYQSAKPYPISNVDFAAIDQQIAAAAP